MKLSMHFNKIITNIVSKFFIPNKAIIFDDIASLQLDSNHNQLVHKQTLNHLPNWPIFSNDWAALWVLICTVHLTICSYHITCGFQRESTIYSCLNVKELLARIGPKSEVWIHSETRTWHGKNIQTLHHVRWVK